MREGQRWNHSLSIYQTVFSFAVHRIRRQLGNGKGKKRIAGVGRGGEGDCRDPDHQGQLRGVTSTQTL